MAVSQAEQAHKRYAQLNSLFFTHKVLRNHHNCLGAAQRPPRFKKRP